MNWVRRNSTVVFLVLIALLFILVFWIGFRANQKEAHNADQVKNATLNLCTNEIAFNELLTHLSDLFETAAFNDHQASLYLALSKALSEGKVEPKACETLLKANNQ